MNESLENLPTLREGDTGNNVIILQNKLKILGYFNASVTGSFGPTTTQAVKSFQRDYGLDPTGVVDYATWVILYEETPSPFPVTMNNVSTRFLRQAKPTLRLGDTGEYVTQLQEQLKQILFYDGPISGIFDNLTQTAVKIFQTTNKLTANGIVGIDTWSALEYLYSPLSICNNQVTEEVVHIVRRGETLYSIARSYGVSVDDIRRLNNLTSNVLSVGQRLIIKEGSSPSVNPNEDIYTVKRGDTLYSIAKMFNTTVDNIKRLNNLTSNVISLGQQLVVPSNEVEDNTTQSQLYIVKRGDTLYSISRQVGISVDELKRLNNLSSNVLTIGQTLVIPNSSSSMYRTYIVQRGDSLYKIARDYGVSVDDIKRLNNLTSNTISIGQQLLIPSLS